MQPSQCIAAECRAMQCSAEPCSAAQLCSTVFLVQAGTHRGLAGGGKKLLLAGSSQQGSTPGNGVRGGLRWETNHRGLIYPFFFVVNSIFFFPSLALLQIRQIGLLLLACTLKMNFVFTIIKNKKPTHPLILKMQCTQQVWKRHTHTWRRYSKCAAKPQKQNGTERNSNSHAQSRHCLRFTHKSKINTHTHTHTAVWLLLANVFKCWLGCCELCTVCCLFRRYCTWSST